jgi:hypothetical protein
MVVHECERGHAGEKYSAEENAEVAWSTVESTARDLLVPADAMLPIQMDAQDELLWFGAQQLLPDRCEIARHRYLVPDRFDRWLAHERESVSLWVHWILLFENEEGTGPAAMARPGPSPSARA